MLRKIIFCAILILVIACKNEHPQNIESNTEKPLVSFNYLQSDSKTIIDRFITEKGYNRETYSPQEFGYFLQQLPLKSIHEKVSYFDGSKKSKNDVYNSVIDLPIGTKDLHQCADATMRLRADYLYQAKRYDEIAFNFISDSQPRYYTAFAKGDFSPEKYWKYLEYIFSYANTASLKDQLKTVKYSDVKIGDLLIQKGNPYGHAVIVVDLITNGHSKKVLLAQSYMPAQELQILDNPSSQDKSPWYDVKEGDIITPEWKFTSDDWKTWE